MKFGYSLSLGVIVVSMGFLVALAASPLSVTAQVPDLPRITSFTQTNNNRQLTWTPYPAAQKYSVWSGTNPTWPLAEDTSGAFNGYNWNVTNAEPVQFFRVGVTPMSSNALLTANVLNRLAYGPTPDELERVSAMGPQAYINEQLAPESITETLGNFTAVATNGVGVPLGTNWSFLSVTGVVSSSLLLVYLTTPGEAYLDDMELKSLTTTITTNISYVTNNSVIATNITTTTNTFLGTNVLVNGDFEASTNRWTAAGALAGSQVDSNTVHSGSGSLHLVASSAGSNQSHAVWQQITPSLPTAGSPKCVLSFWYLPSARSDKLTAKLNGGGVTASAVALPPTPTWYYATATGLASNTPALYIYLSDTGEAFIDDIKLVTGSVAEAGSNLLQNGDFEAPLIGPWRLSTDFTNSYISSAISHSGNGSLKIIATAPGAGSGDSVYQTNIFGLTNGATYTVSFWYIPSTRNRTLTVRLFGSFLQCTPDITPSGLQRRLSTFGGASVETGQVTAQTVNGAGLADLRAWLILNAVGAKRQLLEVMTQFLDNHFVTQQSKSVNYLDTYYDDTTLMDRFATDWEYREVSKWRAALLRPDCTFYDLLRISAESPAMIVYLDTAGSTGNAGNVANENYARELFELFTMGVDNGYDQNDIVAMSRAWTGWAVDIVDKENVNNPFAAPSTTYGFYPGDGYAATSNKIGTWSFRYKPESHGTNRAPILSVWSTNSSATSLVALGPKTVPARFGPPWANASYQLTLPRRPTGDTNSIQDGYDVIWHLANNVPMTAEYISVKLCRLFVHDDFPNPTTRPELPEYAFYDYTDPNHSAEAELVHQCMLAWWNSTPRGNIRAVLQTIFNSELFRGHSSSMQKVKTPLEYAVSAIRALRSANDDGTFTASTDGYSIAGRSRTASAVPLPRMGNMLLFDRDFPDGYPEVAAPWISGGTLAERIRFVQTFLMAPTDSGKADGITGGNLNLADPVALLKKKLPPGSWNNADAVADYFLSILYPGEGEANLSLYRTQAINFLNTSDDGATSSPFVNLSGTNYDTRVRATASMLMSMQRFQEQ